MASDRGRLFLVVLLGIFALSTIPTRTATPSLEAATTDPSHVAAASTASFLAGTTDPAALAAIQHPQDVLAITVSAVPLKGSIGSSLVGKPLAFSKAAAARITALTQAAEQSDVAAAAAPAGMSSQYAGIVSRHNELRCKHSVSPLAWSNYQASQAAAYAAQCVWGHDRNANAGENLYATSAKDDPAAALAAAIKAWYAEVSNYGNPTFSSATGHFTQVVWKGSTQLGCAVQVCSNLRNAWSTGGTLVVCRYTPAGNVYGQFQQNVLPVNSRTDCAGSSDGGGSGGGGGGSPGTPGGGSGGGGGGSGGGGSPGTPGGGSGGGSTPPPAPVPVPPATIPAGFMIQGPGCLPSADGRFKFCVMDDASVVLFGPTNAALWSSGTQGASAAKPFRLVMQKDGNLVALDSKAVRVWSSNTAGRGSGPGYRLLVRDDGNVVVYDAQNIPVWATNTCCQ